MPPAVFSWILTENDSEPTDFEVMVSGDHPRAQGFTQSIQLTKKIWHYWSWVLFNSFYRHAQGPIAANQVLKPSNTGILITIRAT